MGTLFRNPIDIAFDDILIELNLTKEQNVLAIRSSLKVSKIFLKRNSQEISISYYNEDILNLFESNIDLQFVLNEYAVASYIINYVSKTEAGLSKMLHEAVTEMNAENLYLRQKLKRIDNIFINSKVMSAQEAVYICLLMSLSKSSRDCIFINTSPIENRVRILKSKSQLSKLRTGSKDFIEPNIFDKYANREKEYEHWCLADYAALLKPNGVREKPLIIPYLVPYVRYAL